MRKLQLGLATSAAVHLVVLAWLGTSEADRKDEVELPAAPIEIVEIVTPPETPPVQVAVLDEHTPVPSDDPVATAPAPHHASITTSTAHSIETPGVGSGSNTPEVTPGHTSIMTMRRPDVHVQLPGHYDDLEHVPRGTVAVQEPDVSTGQLSPSGNGHMTSNQGEFVVDVERDGTAHVADKPNFHVGSRLPSRKDIGKGVREWQQDPTGEVGTKRQEKSLGDSQTMGNDDKQHESNVVGVGILGGGFDVTDALMRNHGGDPYAAKKLKVLDSTRDERVQIGNKRRHDQLAHANELMQKNLDQMWAKVTDTPGRKQALFELWDESAESGSADLVEAGTAARTLVVGFIRARMPSGSATGYTAAELTAFNSKKQSKAKFAPYE